MEKVDEEFNEFKEMYKGLVKKDNRNPQERKIKQTFSAFKDFKEKLNQKTLWKDEEIDMHIKKHLTVYFLRSSCQKIDWTENNITIFFKRLDELLEAINKNEQKMQSVLEKMQETGFRWQGILVLKHYDDCINNNINNKFSNNNYAKSTNDTIAEILNKPTSDDCEDIEF